MFVNLNTCIYFCFSCPLANGSLVLIAKEWVIKDKFFHKTLSTIKTLVCGSQHTHQLPTLTSSWFLFYFNLAIHKALEVNNFFPTHKSELSTFHWKSPIITQRNVNNLVARGLTQKVTNGFWWKFQNTSEITPNYKLLHFFSNPDHHLENILDLVIHNIQTQKLTVGFW